MLLLLFYFHLKTSFSLSFQLVFSLSSQQQKLNFNALNDWLRQQCFRDRKNYTNNPSKYISELIFANFNDSFTIQKLVAALFFGAISCSCSTPFAAVFVFSRVDTGYITGYRLFSRANRRLHVPHWLNNIPRQLPRSLQFA